MWLRSASPSPPAACKHVFLFVYFLLYLFQGQFSSRPASDNNPLFPEKKTTEEKSVEKFHVANNINNLINFNYLIFIYSIIMPSHINP